MATTKNPGRRTLAREFILLLVLFAWLTGALKKCDHDRPTVWPDHSEIK